MRHRTRVLGSCLAAGFTLGVGACSDGDEGAGGSQQADFWRSQAVSGASEAEYYTSLAELVSSATAVIRGEVVDSGPGRVLQGDVDIDRFETGFISVRVDEVLAGELPSEPRDQTITVETLHRPEGRSSGPTILMLRWSPEVGARPTEEVLRTNPEVADLYTLTNAQAVWIELNGRATNPVLDAEQSATETSSDSRAADEHRDPVLEDVDGLSLEQLEEEIERIGEPQNLPSSFEANHG